MSKMENPSDGFVFWKKIQSNLLDIKYDVIGTDQIVYGEDNELFNLMTTGFVNRISDLIKDANNLAYLMQKDAEELKKIRNINKKA